MDYKRGRPKLTNPGHRVQMVIDEDAYQYLVKISQTVTGAKPTELCSKIVEAWVKEQKERENDMNYEALLLQNGYTCVHGVWTKETSPIAGATCQRCGSTENVEYNNEGDLLCFDCQDHDAKERYYDEPEYREFDEPFISDVQGRL